MIHSTTAEGGRLSNTMECAWAPAALTLWAWLPEPSIPMLWAWLPSPLIPWEWLSLEPVGSVVILLDPLPVKEFNPPPTAPDPAQTASPCEWAGN